jgi:hypothetical protein
MKQLQGRLRKLENQCALRNGHSLDTLLRQAQEIVKHTGLRFEDAANEIVKDLTAEDLGSIIAEAVSQYGKEIVCNEAVLQ